jgi:hypothetical protein
MKKRVETLETIKRKWAKALFHYKWQQEALGNKVEALTKEKTKKDNVLTDLESMNLNNVFLLNFEELRKMIVKA